MNEIAGAQQLSVKLGFISFFQFDQALMAGNLSNAFCFFLSRNNSSNDCQVHDDEMETTI